MAAGGSLEAFAAVLGRALATLAHKLGDETVLETLARLGVAFPPEFLTDQAITTARHSATDAARALSGSVDALRTALAGADATAAIAAGVAVLRDAGAVTGAAAAFADQVRTRGPALPGLDPVQVDALVADLPRRLLDLSIVDAIDDFSPPLSAGLALLGVVERVAHDGVPDDPTRPAFEAVRLRLDQVTGLLGDPAGRLRARYDWGAPDFDGTTLLTALRDALAFAGVPVLLVPASGTTPAELRSLIFTVAATGGGLAVTVGGDVDLTVPETAVPFPGRGWSATVGSSWRLPAGATVTITPPLAIEATTTGGTLSGTVRVRVTAAPAEPILLFGQAGGTRLEVATLGLTGDLTVGPEADLAIGGEVRGGRLVVGTSGADGFISSLLGPVRLESEFGVGFTFSPATGLHFTGSGGVEIQIPVHRSLGPIEVQALNLRAGITGSAVPVELSSSFTGNLGPISASVDRLGIVATVTFPAGGGNLGPLDLAAGFKPPTGVGLAVDAGIVRGGGFLSIDAAAGEYAGALELEFAEFLSLKAIGLITTRMPDGSRGFSLLVVITAEFPGGLQLGFGFTLLGVGGILGLNRGMRLAALMEGVRTGAIESVMFPRDVVANAPRILSDLRAFFPPEPGRFVIGPMAKLGWGTPTLVSISLGVIIEVPGNIAILGVLKVALPSEDAPVLLLQVNFAGAIEFDKRRLYFFASLFGSRVLAITIEGEMGVLVSFGEQREFVLSVGGFHPSFSPPPLPFPSPQRISLNLLNTDVARIGVSGYFAVTSNTVQFGARADLFFGFSALSVKGHLAFDALFQFSPFRFVVAVSAGVSVRVFGVGAFSVTLDAELSGPTPWRIAGSASISLLFFSISVDVDETWGEERDTTVPSVEVLPLLAVELAKPESWRTRLPAGGSPRVSLRTLPGAEAEVVLHPLGALVVQQRLVPLDIRVDRVGAQRAADVSQCTVTVATGGLERAGDALDAFAVAQFQDLSDADKLSLPSFEDQHAGVEVVAGGAAMASSRAVRRSARYEQVVIDGVRTPSSLVSYTGSLFTHQLAGSSVARSPLAQAERALRQPFTDRIRVEGDRYVVASTLDNTAASTAFASHALARAHLAGLLADDPGREDELHVIPAMEVAS